MSGKEVKEIIRNEGFTIAEVAKLLNFDSEQRLHSALKSDDVKSGLLEKIAEVTNRSVLLFYPTSGVIAQQNSIAVSGNNSPVSTISERFIGLLENKDKQINKRDEQMDRLLGIIEKLNS